MLYFSYLLRYSLFTIFLFNNFNCSGSIFDSWNLFIQQSSPKQAVEDILNLGDIKINGKNPWDIDVHNDNFYNAVLKDGSLGLGETYMAGWWDTPALDECIFRMCRAKLTSEIQPTWALRWAILKANLFNNQDKSGSLKVIEEHYQLGNELFKHMLDETLAYSCGYWKNATTLSEAQKAKFDLIARKLGLKKGMRVLDIGCGWGGFAKYISQNYEVQVVGVTLSENQAAHAKEINKGLPVEIIVQDYRDIDGKFDRVVEIGMFEHVGQKNYREFMELVHRFLEEDGLFMLHTIGTNVSSLVGDPWMNKYIFPNGQVPSISQIGEAIEGLFIMEDWHNFSADYDKTLMAWHKNFVAHWNKLKDNYPASFYRMWNFYLLSCAGAFRARNLQLWQVVLSKNGVLGGYETVR